MKYRLWPKPIPQTHTCYLGPITLWILLLVGVVWGWLSSSISSDHPWLIVMTFCVPLWFIHIWYHVFKLRGNFDLFVSIFEYINFKIWAHLRWMDWDITEHQIALVFHQVLGQMKSFSSKPSRLKKDLQSWVLDHSSAQDTQMWKHWAYCFTWVFTSRNDVHLEEAWAYILPLLHHPQGWHLIEGLNRLPNQSTHKQWTQEMVTQARPRHEAERLASLIPIHSVMTKAPKVRL